MSIRILALIVNILLSISLLAQNGVSFVASSDAKQIVLGSYFEVSFTLNNADGKDFRAPSFKEFVQLNKTPSQSTSISGVNGKYTKKISYAFSLQPKKVGKFTIGAASIKVGNKTLRTDPITIEVLKGKNNASSQKELDAAQNKQMYIKAELSTEEARIGQQVLLDYKLYTTTNIENYNITEESEYLGFYANEMNRFNSRVIREVIDGVQYSTKILKRVALFPQQAGSLTIDPLYMNLGVAVDNGRRARSFFSYKQLKNYPVQTEPIKINVKPLPPGAPATFSGAVGQQYSINSSVSRNQLSTDDAIAIRMTINGNGDVKRVQAPPLNLSKDFEIYDPKVIDESNFEAGGQIRAKKVVEYLVLPKKPGQYNIQPAFSYFDTDSSAYVTLSPERFMINVTPGTNKPNNINVAPTSPTAQTDIRFIKTTSTLSRNGHSFFGSGLFFGLLLFPLVAFGGVLLFKRIQQSRSNIDAGVLKRRRAKKLAEKRLASAKQYLDQNQAKAFYDEISRASFGYVCDKLSIPFSELTKANVESKLRSLQVKEDNINSFMHIIQTCEMALFAGKDNSAAMTSTYQNAVEVITKIEADLS